MNRCRWQQGLESTSRNWFQCQSFRWKWVIRTQQRSGGFLLNSHKNGCSSHLWVLINDQSWKTYVIPVLQMMLMALLEGGQFTDITRVCSTLKPQLCLQPWKRWWTTLRTLLGRRHWNQTEVENASHCDEGDHFRNHLNHPEVTLRPLDATWRNIWIIWAMRCYTSRQGPCQAVPGGFRLGLQVFMSMWFVHAVMSGDISDTNGEGLCSLHTYMYMKLWYSIYTYDIWYVVAGWHNCTTRKCSITVSSCLWSFLGLMSPCQGRNRSLASRCGKL